MSERVEATPVTDGSGNWRERLKALGKGDFELEEMIRLGFWPPSPDAAVKDAEIRVQLEELAERMAPLLERERELQGKLNEAADEARQIAEIRRRRIERVQAARLERRARQEQEKKERAEQDKRWRAQSLPHLGREISGGLRYEGGDTARVAALGLPAVQTAAELAALLEVEPSRLAWLCYHRSAAAVDHYRHFSIPKKKGGERQISAPKPALRAAQQVVLDKILRPVPVHEAAMAFLPQSGILQNAEKHAHRESGGPAFVVRADLQDFFPSITFRRVKWTFASLGYNEGVSSLLALLCTEAPRVKLELDGRVHHVALRDRFLPQGACTSPALTNILCRRLDKRMAGMAQYHGMVYTRYADDLVFSTAEDKPNLTSFLRLLRLILEDEKLVLNEKKLAVERRHQRQSVTGLVVNGDAGGGPRISRRDLRHLRAVLHTYETKGAEVASAALGKDALSWARGYVAYVQMVDAGKAQQLREKHPWLVASPPA